MVSIACAVTSDIVTDRRMLRICTTLHNAGYRVTLVGRQRARSLALPALPFEAKRLSCQAEQGPWFYIEYNVRLFFALKKLKADIYVAVDYDTLKAVNKAAKAVNSISVFDAHEWFEEVPELAGRDQVKNFWRRLARKEIPKTTMRYTVSGSIAEVLEVRYFKPFSVIHNYPLLRNEGPINRERENVIVYLGVLNVGRGLEQAIEALTFIEDVHLWLIGTGDIDDLLKKRVQDLGLSARVTFWGLKKPSHIQGLLTRAKIGINVLNAGSLSYKMSLANKFFDYVHAGLPQICVDLPEYRLHNSRYQVATLIDDLEVSQLVFAMRNLLSDKVMWDSLHNNCLEAREHWCWEMEEQKLLDLYNSLK